MTSGSQRLRVLLTNDDGPPGKDSPYIFGLARHLVEDLDWDVKVVVPSTQKSWIGKAYHIKEITKGFYYYPRLPDGIGETSSTSRPLKRELGEFAEWILLDGTPATCANIALNNLFKDSIDLVISGPNLGRNSSSAFALSSGTIGAALSASLSRCRAIALSYGTVQNPVPPQLFDPAHKLAIKIIQSLLRNWGKDKDGLRNGQVDLYNVNIPMVNDLLNGEGLPVLWTKIWRNAYGRLFKPFTLEPTGTEAVPAGGPDAQLSSSNKGDPADRYRSEAPQTDAFPQAKSLSSKRTPGEISHAPELVFKFAPDMSGLIGPRIAAPVGSDAWALERGYASVTPLRASFAEPPLADSEGEAPAESVEFNPPDGEGPKLFKLRL
ncbi:sure-like protein [Fomitiporia mediterranea MF3/22]|uniref:sure-like protein n=1 Tax=Fomitiporia mediterranea (strain MF3/22) TaxID=694068 RepID=UPI000440893E|nr:sure-like protein [Fomitiporia mediterranea MF3/22]EJD03904.1 sure-like protein [Fomitiporia mediterranea MF3/22]